MAGCDQVVLSPSGDELREKPASAAQAEAFLASYANAHCTTVNGLCVVNTETGARATGCDQVRVEFGPLSREAIAAAVDGGNGTWVAKAPHFHTQFD